MSNEDKLQEKYVEFQMYDQQLKQVKNQLERIDQQLLDLAMTEQSLEELKKTKQGTEILVPVSNGIFAKSSIKDNSDLIVNVGANVGVPKSVNDTIELITKQQVEISNYKESLIQQFYMVSVKLQEIEKELQVMIG